MRSLFALATFVILLQYAASAQSELGQNAPTLQVGLDNLAFTKGTLDAQLIMEIIAAKQSEIKIKLVQNMILDKLENSGGAVYSYADNVVRAVIEEKDHELRTRKVLENTINVVFVYAFCDYYVRNLKARGDVIRDALDVAAKELKATLPQTITSLTDLKNSLEVPTGKANVYLVEALAADQNSLPALILDIAAEVVRHNENFKQLGLLQISYSATYEFMNTYLDIDAKKQKALFDALGTIKNDMRIKLDAVSNLIGLLYYATNQFTFKYNQLNTSEFASEYLANVAKASTIDMVPVKTKLDLIINALTGAPDSEQSLQNDVEALSRVRQYIEKCIKFFGTTPDVTKNQSTLSDMLYAFHGKFIPMLSAMSFRHKEIPELVTLLTGSSELISANLWDKLTAIQDFTKKVEPFVLLAAKLYEFDRAQTISDYLKLVTELEGVFADSKIKSALSIVNSFVKDHASVKVNEDGKETLEFNVESFLLKLDKMKLDRWRPVQLSLTVGASSGFFTKPLMLGLDTLKSFSSISEKIGIKIKIFDWEFWKSRNPGETYEILGTSYVKTAAPKQPIVSDLHVMAFGSGLLYNILNTSTSKEFNAPLAGAGLGVTFFNALDMSLTASIPILPTESLKTSAEYVLLGLSFDIRLGEYLQRAREKRESNRQQKALSKAID